MRFRRTAMLTALKSLYYFVDVELGKLLVSKTKLMFFCFIFLSFFIGLTINDMTPIESLIGYGITALCIIYYVIRLSQTLRKEKRIIHLFFKEAQRIVQDSKHNTDNKKCKILNFTSKK